MVTLLTSASVVSNVVMNKGTEPVSQEDPWWSPVGVWCVQRPIVRALESSTMTSYRVVPPDGPEDGIRVECEAHGESQTFQPGYRTVAFHCSECDIEVGIRIEDTEDWRELTEMC